MTATEMAAYVGITGDWILSKGVRVKVEVVDAKEMWGELRLKVRPVAGIGETWTLRSKVSLDYPPSQRENRKAVRQCPKCHAPQSASGVICHKVGCVKWRG